VLARERWEKLTKLSTHPNAPASRGLRAGPGLAISSNRGGRPGRIFPATRGHGTSSVDRSCDRIPYNLQLTNSGASSVQSATLRRRGQVRTYSGIAPKVEHARP